MFFPRNIYFLFLASLPILCNGVTVSAASLKETDLEAVVDRSDDSFSFIPEVGSIIDTEFSEFSDTYFEDEEDDKFYFLRAGARRTQSTSTSERKNISQKLGESVIQSIIGCLLIVCVPFVIWKNEGRHVDQLCRIDFCKNNAVVVDW